MCVCACLSRQAGADIWEDGRIRAELVASGKPSVVQWEFRFLWVSARVGACDGAVLVCFGIGFFLKIRNRLPSGIHTLCNTPSVVRSEQTVVLKRRRLQIQRETEGQKESQQRERERERISALPPSREQHRSSFRQCPRSMPRRSFALHIENHEADISGSPVQLRSTQRGAAMKLRSTGNSKELQ